MKLPVSLGIKPALITAAVLLLVIGGMGIKLALVAGERDTAVAERSAAITERDSWKAKTADALAANQAYDVIFTQQAEAAKEQQRLADEAARKAAAAVAASRREEAAAERRLSDFQRRYMARPKTCDDALKVLDAVCPTIGRDY